jgi:cell division septation protein DedD
MAAIFCLFRYIVILMDRQTKYFTGLHGRLGIIIALTSLHLSQVYAGGPVYEEGMAAYSTGDYSTAYRLWKPLAKHGDADAQFALGTLYHDGIGVPVDRTESSYWFQLAAEQGLADAQYNLGNAYLHGEGVRQNDSMAIYWWEKAAKQSMSYAQFNLDRAYQERSGTDKNKQSTTRIYGQITENPSDLDDTAKLDKSSWPAVDPDIENMPQPATDKAAVSAQTPSIRAAVVQGPAITALESADKSGNWAINLVSYSRESTARRTLDNYRKQGINAEIQTATVKEKPIYRVRIVGYESLQAAQAQIVALQELLDLDSVWASRK